MFLGMVSPDLCRNSVWIRVEGSYLLEQHHFAHSKEVMQSVCPPPLCVDVVGVGEGPRRLGEKNGRQPQGLVDVCVMSCRFCLG